MYTAVCSNLLLFCSGTLPPAWLASVKGGASINGNAHSCGSSQWSRGRFIRFDGVQLGDNVRLAAGEATGVARKPMRLKETGRLMKVEDSHTLP